MKNYSLNFWKFPVTNGTAFSGISRIGKNLGRYNEIFGNFLPGISVQLNGSLFENSAIPEFLETFAGNLHTIFPRL